MNPLSTLFLFSLPCLITIFVCNSLLFLIPKLQIWDIPQARSAHSYPISKGGGIGILAGFFTGYFFWYVCHPAVELLFSQIYALSALLFLAIFSLIDDIRSQNVWLKLGVQIISSYVAMLSLSLSLPLTLFFSLICVILLNVINFMDGLNGLASLSMIISSAFLLKAHAQIAICLPLIVALLCFLPWNFPKARLFMGDVGSQSCALILCLAAGSLIISHQNQPIDIRIILLFPALLSGMIFDVFLTLCRRFFKKESLTKAHNTHLYQLAARSKLLPPAYISLLECGFVFLGGIIDLYAPLSLIVTLLLIPQIIWSFIVLHFWKISQAR
ncbi:hypothetical protein FAI41_08955 [Acetobacteraceae bacterium]|nr:hypothetical protein FAI41_08955 [Acetobacteraceae bacterium]